MVQLFLFLVRVVLDFLGLAVLVLRENTYPALWEQHFCLPFPREGNLTKARISLFKIVIDIVQHDIHNRRDGLDISSGIPCTQCIDTSPRSY